jgi:hypothetical protein
MILWFLCILPKKDASNLGILSKLPFTNGSFLWYYSSYYYVSVANQEVPMYSSSSKGAGSMTTKHFSNNVKAETDRTHIGPYEAWLENGSLHIYGHQVGHATGSNLSMTPKETLSFLEWLSNNQETLSQVRRSPRYR